MKSHTGFFVPKMWGCMVHYVLKSNLFISLCAVAMVLTGRLLLPQGPLRFPFALLIAVGCATFIIYNLTQFLISTRHARQNPATSASWYQQHTTSIKLLLLLCLLAFLSSVFFIRWQAVAVLAFLGVLSLLYNIPDQYIHQHYQSLRTVPLLKIFVIAFVWASIGSWLPYYWASGAWQAAVGMFAAQFCFIMAITLPFDIRDYQQDEKSHLLTIPGVFGVKNTRMLSLFFLGAYGLFMLFFFTHTGLATLLLIATSAPLLLFAQDHKPYWFFTGLLDGLILLQYFLLLVFA